MSDTPAPKSHRGIGFGEIIGSLALIISGLGVWIAWESANREAGPTRVVEQRQAIPLTLRARAQDDGRKLIVEPVEPGHALQSLFLTVARAKAISIGSDGELASRDVEDALETSGGERKGSHSIPVQIEARYVEAGTDRSRTATYQLRYHWVGGGLFDGPKVRLDGLSRG
jgi:hypothetical protein